MSDADLSLWRNQTPEDVYEEAKRAREAEAELADVLAALESRTSSQYASDPGYHVLIINHRERRAIRAALRLAGRIQ